MNGCYLRRRNLRAQTRVLKRQFEDLRICLHKQRGERVALHLHVFDSLVQGAVTLALRKQRLSHRDRCLCGLFVASQR